MTAVKTVQKKKRRRLTRSQSVAVKANSVLRRLVDFNGLKAMTLTLDSVDPRFVEPLDAYESRVIRGPELREYVNPDIMLTEEFIEEQIENGSFLLAYFDSGRIISYGWYLDKPHEVQGRYRYRFDESYLHMFNGFTTKEYRGQNIHAFGMGQALKLAEEQGFKGLVSEVGVTNFASLKSCERLGYRIFGFACSFKVLGKRFCLRTSGCRANNYWLEPIPGD